MATKTNLKYNVDNRAGLARTGVSRLTGTRLSIWFAPEAKGIKANADKPWVIECEDHKVRRECATRTEARLHREDPASFCTKCKAVIGKGGTKAPAKKAAPAKATAAKKATRPNPGRNEIASAAFRKTSKATPKKAVAKKAA